MNFKYVQNGIQEGHKSKKYVGYEITSKQQVACLIELVDKVKD